MTVYLDHAATTPLRVEAFDAMRPWLTTSFGNPSGGRRVARAARQAVDEAREVTAIALGCEPGEVIFTSGGTEADNLAVAGTIGASAGRGGPTGAVCSAIEHHAVLLAVEAVGGATVGVDAEGRIDLDQLADAVGPETILVSVMLANNEVGTVQDLAAVAAVVAERAPRAVIHTDAVQAAAWLDVPVWLGMRRSCRWPLTSSVARRGSASSWPAMVSASSPSCAAVVRNASAGAARTTSPESSGSPPLWRPR